MRLLVTHRVHTLKSAEQIVLLHQGKVLATGHHNELQALPEYQRLYALNQN